MEVTSSAAVPLKFKIGDRVRVDLDVDVLKTMQDGHGGWHPKMADVRMHAVIFLCFYVVTTVISFQCSFKCATPCHLCLDAIDWMTRRASGL